MTRVMFLDLALTNFMLYILPGQLSASFAGKCGYFGPQNLKQLVKCRIKGEAGHGPSNISAPRVKGNVSISRQITIQSIPFNVNV